MHLVDSNLCHVTDLLVVDLPSSLSTSYVMTHSLPVASKLQYIKTLVARQTLSLSLSLSLKVMLPDTYCQSQISPRVSSITSGESHMPPPPSTPTPTPTLQPQVPSYLRGWKEIKLVRFSNV